jgi:hypothetical protein
MKIKRKGNPKGLDIDCEVTNISTEEAEKLHNSLLKKGYLFMYASNGKYEPPTKNVILHYIDKNLKLYDYAILFTKQEPRTKTVKGTKSKISEAYEKAKTDPEFKERLMEYMRYDVLFYAFSKRIGLYGKLEGEYLVRFNKVLKEIKDIVPLPDEYTVDSIVKLKSDLFTLFLS